MTALSEKIKCFVMVKDYFRVRSVLYGLQVRFCLGRNW